MKSIHLSTSVPAGNSSGVDLRRSLHHSQRLHLAGAAASSPPSGGGEGQSGAGGRGPRIWTARQPQPVQCHDAERGGCCRHRDHLPAERKVSQSPESLWWRRFSTISVSCTVSEPGQAESAPLLGLCCQRGASLPAASLRGLQDSTADVWIRRKFKSLGGI